MALVQYGKANCTDGSSSIVTWAEGSQDVRRLPEFFTVDDSNTDQVAAYDTCPWLYRLGGYPPDSNATQNTGMVLCELLNTIQGTDYGVVETMPLYDPRQGAMFSQVGSVGQAWKPLQVVHASDLIQVIVNATDLNPLLFDTINISGEVWVWNQTGANLIFATFSASGLNSASFDSLGPTDVSRLVGTDLSLVGGNAITSAAGGVYNALLRIIDTSWD